MKTMKKVIVLATMLFAIGFSAMAQDNASKQPANTPMEDFFIGQWKLNVYGLPNGDAVMLLVIQKVDGELAGTIGGMEDANPSKLTKVEIDKKTLTVRFMGGGYDVPMYLDKTGDDTVEGSMNDMFDVDGKKITAGVIK